MKVIRASLYIFMFVKELVKDDSELIERAWHDYFA